MPPEKDNTNSKPGDGWIPLIVFIKDFVEDDEYKRKLTKTTEYGANYNRYFMITYNWMKDISNKLWAYHSRNEAHSNISPLT